MNAFTASLFFVAIAGAFAAPDPKSKRKETPMDEVVKLIKDLRGKVMEDGSSEQVSFDKYACWCEDTTSTKAREISEAKDLIAKTETQMKKLEGQIASHGAEIAQLKKDAAKNADSQRETQAMRDRDFAEYDKDKVESEQCIGALEAAIKVLTNAGKTRLTGFLDTSNPDHQAQLISVAASLRTVLHQRTMPASISDQDLAVVKSFIESPDHFASKHSLSAAQVGQNPFGDYAPQSTQIQGILKGMYDAFTADLEKDNAAEADSQKSFEALMATKRSEQATLAATLQTQEAAHAAKTNALAEANVERDDTIDELNAADEVFTETKAACKTKATEWSHRTRLRTEELAGMNQAISILSSKSAIDTFGKATTTFLQLTKAVNMAANHQHEATDGKGGAFGKLKTLAAKFQSTKVAKIALVVQQGGQLDKVMSMIDDMIVLLRKEEQDDIEHRAKCETAQKFNSDAMNELKENKKHEESRLADQDKDAEQLHEDIAQKKDELRDTEMQIPALLEMRNKEVKEHRQALKDDADSIVLLKQAIAALSKFYENNKIPLGLAQKAVRDESTGAPAPAPIFTTGNYGGRKSESSGIIAILGMLVEDFEKEMKEARSDDVAAQATFEYEKQNNAIIKSVNAQKQNIADMEDDLADLKAATGDTEKKLKETGKNLGSEEKTNQLLGVDCKWIEKHFKIRRDNRKDEMNGLMEAKAFISQVVTGQDPLPPMGVIQKAGKVHLHSMQLDA